MYVERMKNIFQEQEEQLDVADAQNILQQVINIKNEELFEMREYSEELKKNT